MNAQILNINPLSPSLYRKVVSSPSRRHFVGNVPIAMERLDDFNRWMRKLCHAPFDRDQIATASRELQKPSSHARYPESIEQRLRLAYAVRRMLTDAGWRVSGEAIAPAQLVLDYMRAAQHLVPSDMPVFGRLDDAIVIDVAWPQLAGEVESYLDYCRIRDIEAELRHCAVTDFTFTREDWEEERQAESMLIEHCRKSSTGSYLPQASSPLFRVH